MVYQVQATGYMVRGTLYGCGTPGTWYGAPYGPHGPSRMQGPIPARAQRGTRLGYRTARNSIAGLIDRMEVPL